MYVPHRPKTATKFDVDLFYCIEWLLFDCLLKFLSVLVQTIGRPQFLSLMYKLCALAFLLHSIYYFVSSLTRTQRLTVTQRLLYIKCRILIKYAKDYVTVIYFCLQNVVSILLIFNLKKIRCLVCWFCLQL